ncbi:MAG TPA: hypothetical protein PK373_06715 [Sedimentisphaerales bacterium]|nr:hypothetical protein [Phycisphaerae bacterium]HON90615.1 hypothetical protein [Sedimentisphaerales bacterium]HQG48763.1 hypothetical protein [Sedimentisphaerales bacterium]
MESTFHHRALWIGVAAGLLCLTGCGGPGSASALRSDCYKAYSFEVGAGYQVVHERILLRARRRYAMAETATFQPGVSDRSSTENQSSSITLWDGGGIGIRYRIRAEIRAIDADHTQVDLYAAAKRDRAEARLWVGWADTPLGE